MYNLSNSKIFAVINVLMYTCMDMIGSNKSDNS